MRSLDGHPHFGGAAENQRIAASGRNSHPNEWKTPLERKIPLAFWGIGPTFPGDSPLFRENRPHFVGSLPFWRCGKSRLAEAAAMAEIALSKGTPLPFRAGDTQGIGGFSAQNRILSVIFYLWIPIRIQISGLPLLYPAQGKPATPRIYARPPATSRLPLRLPSPVPPGPLCQGRRKKGSHRQSFWESNFSTVG